MRKGIVAVDIGGSHITSVMINTVTGEFMTPVQEDKIDSKKSLEVIIKGWYNNISTTISKAPHTFSNQIAIAIPGPFDYQNGIGLRHESDKFAALENVNIRTLLNNKFQQDINIHFENDAS